MALPESAARGRFFARVEPKEKTMHYKIYSLSLIVTLFAVVILSASGADEAASPDPYANEIKEQRDARMKWWREARFGMFIHWGVYSVPAGTYKDQQIKGIGEWIMNRGKIPCAEYQAFAKQFNPVKYNADEWVRLAKDAGMKYMVITMASRCSARRRPTGTSSRPRRLGATR